VSSDSPRARRRSRSVAMNAIPSPTPMSAGKDFVRDHPKIPQQAIAWMLASKRNVSSTRALGERCRSINSNLPTASMYLSTLAVTRIVSQSIGDHRSARGNSLTVDSMRRASGRGHGALADSQRRGPREVSAPANGMRVSCRRGEGGTFRSRHASLDRASS